MAHGTDTLLTAMFEYGLDLRGRRVFLQCGIEEGEEPGENVAEQVIRGLLYLDKTAGDIELWINTPGGDVDDMFAIYDVIRTCENDVQTIGHGVVASAGALILAGGTPGKRYAMPNTTYMVHEFQCGVDPDIGTRQQKVQLEAKERAEDRWAHLMAMACKRAGKRRTKSYWLNQIRQHPEVWMDAREMLSRGVVDEIWPPDEDDS